MISIKHIAFHNFRQYKHLDLAFNDKNGLYLFIGKNGMGKSNFLNAVCWCLYKSQPFKFRDDDKKLLNEDAGNINQYDEVSVEIEVEMEDRTFLFKRIWRETWDDSKFLVMLKDKEDWIEVDDPVLIRNSFLPETVSKYFLFDGEAVQNLYKGDYSINLKDGIQRVSDVFLLDSAFEHISKTYEDIRRIVSRESPETNNLEKDLSKLVDDKKSLESQNLKDADLVKNLKDQVIKLNQQLEKYNKYRDFQDTKKKLNQEIDEASGLIETYKKQIDDIIVEYAPFWFIKEDLVETAKHINQEGLKGELPPRIRDTFIDELLDKGECICGTHIPKDGEAYVLLVALKEKVSPLSERTYLIEDKVSINSLVKKVGQELYGTLRDIKDNRSKARQKLSVLETRLKEIEEKLINAPEPEVGNIQVALNGCNEQIENKHKEIGQHEYELKQTEKKIQEIQENLNRLNQSKGRFEMENKKAVFLEEARDKVEYIRERLIDQVRRSVSLNTDKYFKELIWEQDKFDKVNFSENYEVEVIKRNVGSNSLKELSTGEMKVLSFATIKALDLLSGFSEVPLFIDGPLENLDEQVQGNFLNLLPSFLENKQVFIFSLDKPVIINFAKKNVKSNNFYRLTRDGVSKSTTINKYE